MTRNVFWFSLMSLAAACGDPADGTITATVYGEEFIEEGIPAEALLDGWAISFDKFLVSIGNVAGKAGEGAPEVGDTAFRIVDLAQASGGEGFELASFAAPGGDYDHFGYQLKADPAATTLNAFGDAEMLKAGGYSVWVTGSASKDGTTKTFDWAFSLTLTYGRCDLMSTVDGNDVRAEATIHADHFFFDDAVSDEPNLAFQIMADADTNGDNAITLEELAAVDIRSQARYQVGSLKDPAGNAITNLRQYVEYQVVTLGHINGEGHCGDQIGVP